MDMQWWGLPAATIVVAVVEIAKRLGLDTRWAGVMASGLGVLGGIAAYLWADSHLAASAAQGLVVGLAAAGLWSAGKAAAGR